MRKIISSGGGGSAAQAKPAVTPEAEVSLAFCTFEKAKGET